MPNAFTTVITCYLVVFSGEEIVLSFSLTNHLSYFEEFKVAILNSHIG